MQSSYNIQPSYLHDLIIVYCSACSQHSLFIFGHFLSSTYIILVMNNRFSFLLVSGVNCLFFCDNLMPGPLISDSRFPEHDTSSHVDSPLSLSITPSLFHPSLNYLFHKSFTLFRHQDRLHGFLNGLFLQSIYVFVLVSLRYCFCYIFGSMQTLISCTTSFFGKYMHAKSFTVITSPVKTSLHGQNVRSQIVPILR